MEALAPQANTDTRRSWESTVTRSAILSAARRVAQRDGILDMSLTGVAAEAGFAPASVYAYFASKNELLLGVVADDLATLAQAMRDAMEHPEKSAPASRDDSTNSKAVNPIIARNEEPMSGGAAEAIAQLQKTVATLEQRPVDAWLERRLREFERALAALEGRRTEKGAVEQNIDERLRDVGQSVEALERRLIATAEDTAQRFARSMDACENRLRQLVSETHSEAATLDRRLTAIENAAFAAKPEFFPPSPPVDSASDNHPETQAIPPMVDGANAAPLLGVGPPPYLDVARKSAQAAARTENVRARKKSRRKSETMIYLSMGSLFLFVAMLTAMGFLLRNQAINQTPAIATTRAQATAPPTRSRAQLAARGPAIRLGALAQAGNANAELLLGLASLTAKTSRSDAIAFQWLSRAAARNQPVAEYQLGTMYQNGRGVEADESQAFRWFESAAMNGNRKAMHSVATCYAEGWGTQKDLTEAARWFARAAALGLVNDQFNLGVLYERGMGVPQNLVDAYKWYAIAAAQGDKESGMRIRALASTLSPDDLAAASDAAASFKPDAVSADANEAPSPAQLR